MTEQTYNGTGERIDSYLAREFPYSRNFFHHIIERGGIRVKNKSVKKSYKLKKGDNIEIDDLQRYLDPVILEEAPKIDIPIVLEKEDYLVINKPKGVLSHPNSVWDISNPSVVGFLYHKFKELPSIGNFIRAGLVHRLDKGTDGLMIIAKTEKGLEHFKKLFQAKSESDGVENKEKVNLKKYYQATCRVMDVGKDFLDEIKGKLPYYIQEDVIPKVPNCVVKEGITKILTVLGSDLLQNKILTGNENQAKNSNKDLIGKMKPGLDTIQIKLEILTGRTHQIRYHLAKYGLPIVGDYLYGIDKKGPIQLTAKKLVFKDLDGEVITLEI